MSDTPRTDAVAGRPDGYGGQPDQVDADFARQLELQIAVLREALQEIESLDPNIDSDEGFNEWGEADCFHQAQAKARAALKATEDK